MCRLAENNVQVDVDADHGVRIARGPLCSTKWNWIHEKNL